MTERAELRERETRRRECEVARGSSIRIPRHAPFYHIDRHSNDSLSSNDVGMHYSPGRKRDVGERGIMREESEQERGERGGRSYRMVYHATPRCADVGRRGLNASENARRGEAPVGRRERKSLRES